MKTQKSSPSVPTHIAIIPDGNRRWARQRGLPPVEGHRQAEKVVPALVKKAATMGVSYITLWALSTENLISRSKDEVDHLFLFLRQFLRSQLSELKKSGIRIRVIGNMEKLPIDLQKQLHETQEQTRSHTQICFVIAINYGGRDEIKRAIAKMKNHILSHPHDDVELDSYLDTNDIPDPDMIIRTGGEKRTSGFLLWQAQYAEYMFVGDFFPDFTPALLERCIGDYAHRERRFGK